MDRRTTIRVQCRAACKLSATLRFRGAKLGSGAARFAHARTSVITIKLTSAATKKLRRTRTGSVALAVTASAGTLQQRLGKTMALKR
jgi:hypothetical protein